MQRVTVPLLEMNTFQVCPIKVSFLGPFLSVNDLGIGVVLHLGRFPFRNYQPTEHVPTQTRKKREYQGCKTIEHILQKAYIDYIYVLYITANEPCHKKHEKQTII